MSIPEPEEPNDVAASEFKRKGEIAFVGQKFLEALLAYTQSLKHSTSNHIVWANRSAVYLRVKQPHKALEDARIARTIDETYAKVRKLLLRTLSVVFDTRLLECLSQATYVFHEPAHSISPVPC